MKQIYDFTINHKIVFKINRKRVFTIYLKYSKTIKHEYDYTTNRIQLIKQKRLSK